MQYLDFLFLHTSFIREHDLLNMNEYFYKKCFPIVQTVVSNIIMDRVRISALHLYYCLNVVLT